MRLGTLNIRNFPDMRPGQVAEDAATAARETSLCGLQEIQVGEDTPIVVEALPRHWELVGGLGTSPIILNRKRWDLLDSHSTRTRRPKLSRVENPFLDITTVLVQSVRRPGLRPFVVVNTHLVSGGYNAQHLPDVKAQWDREWLQVQQVVSHWRTREAATVYLVGDLNHHRPPELVPAPRFRWLTPAGTSDHVGQLVHPGSVRMDSPTHQATDVHSDHSLHVVSGTLSRA